MAAAKSLSAQLKDKILIGDDCWEWAGARAGGGPGGGGGYGTIGIRRQTRHAHRVVYELLVGPIPEGMDLDHLCRNRGCVRPSHLEPVTRQVNLLRARDIRTHCLHGHALTEANLYRHKGHGRRCRTCVLEAGRRWRQSQ